MESEAQDNREAARTREAQEDAPKASESSHSAQEITRINEENEQLKKEMLYIKADFENYKKRILREQDQAIRFANEKVFRELLTVADLLDRGIRHGKALESKANPSAEDTRSFLNGIELTAKELAQLLNRFGVEFIGAAGEKFDPARHEALSEIETLPEQVGHVVEVLQRGCSLHGRLLMPARVVVGKNKN